MPPAQPGDRDDRSEQNNRVGQTSHVQEEEIHPGGGTFGNRNRRRRAMPVSATPAQTTEDRKLRPEQGCGAARAHRIGDQRTTHSGTGTEVHAGQPGNDAEDEMGREPENEYEGKRSGMCVIPSTGRPCHYAWFIVRRSGRPWPRRCPMLRRSSGITRGRDEVAPRRPQPPISTTRFSRACRQARSTRCAQPQQSDERRAIAGTIRAASQQVSS